MLTAVRDLANDLSYDMHVEPADSLVECADLSAGSHAIATASVSFAYYFALQTFCPA
jgi:hypothetical protein